MKSLYVFVGVLLAVLLIPFECSEVDEWQQTQIMTMKGVTKYDIMDCAIGDFMRLVTESTMYIDKSLIIKKIWHDTKTTIFIITGPPRWGKTINLSLIKEYHELKLDIDGSPVTKKTETEQYQFFVYGKISTNNTVLEYESPPLISGFENNRHLGAYPIIHLDGSILNRDYGVPSIRSMILRSFSSHEGLYERLKTSKKFADIENFEAYYLRSEIQKQDPSSLVIAYSTLSDLLFKAYGKRPIILFDEYDAYVHETYFARSYNNITTSSLTASGNEFDTLFRMLMRNTFKSNQQLERAVLTGVLGVHETTFLSGMNNVDFFQVFGEKDFFPYYGIFGPEFLRVAQTMSLNDSEIQNIAEYYEGYHTLSNLNVPIYSMYSLTKCVTNRVIDDYWKHNFVYHLIPQLLQQNGFRNVVVRLLREYQTDSTSVSTNKLKFPRMSLDDCEHLRDLKNRRIPYDGYVHDEITFGLLLSVGIVSIHPTCKSKSPDEIMVRIPNKEIWNYLNKLIVTALGIKVDEFLKSATQIQEYVNGNNDLLNLPPMTQKIAELLYEDTGRKKFGHMNTPSEDGTSTPVSNLFTEEILGTEKAVETLLKIMFQNALQNNRISAHLHRLKIGEQLTRVLDHMTNPVVDLVFIVGNITVLIIEIKYKRHTDSISDKTMIDNAFKQCVSYSAHFRKFKITEYSYYKFLAVSVSDLITVQTKSLTIPFNDLAEMMNLAEGALDKAVRDDPNAERERRKDNKDIWEDSMHRQTLRKHPDKIHQSLFALPELTTTKTKSSDAVIPEHRPSRRGDMKAPKKQKPIKSQPLF